MPLYYSIEVLAQNSTHKYPQTLPSSTVFQLDPHNIFFSQFFLDIQVCQNLEAVLHKKKTYHLMLSPALSSHFMLAFF